MGPLQTLEAARANCKNLQVTLDTTNLLLKHTVPEPTLKLSASRARRRDRHGILSTTDDDLQVSYGLGYAERRTYGRSGVIAALFNGVSVGYTFISSSVSESNI